MTTPIITDGSLDRSHTRIVSYRKAPADVFATRAQRLMELARGHALEGYLRFASALCIAQHQALAQPAAHWRARLRQVMDHITEDALPDPARRSFTAVAKLKDEELDRQASAVLAGDFAAVPPGHMPWLAAGLQAHHTAEALQTDERGLNHGTEAGQCPYCDGPPVASVVRIGDSRHGLRYLVCALCSGEWHYTRVKCSTCTSTKGISYLSLESATASVKAETCEACQSYLKIFYMEKDAEVEAHADDLATLAMDLLVDEAGYRRLGPNLLLQPG